MNFDDLKIPRCKNFTGYKPCYSYKNCLLNGCVNNTEHNKTGVKILIISLDAMGNVLDNTPVLHSIKRKFPVSTIYWITKNDAVKVLNNSVLIDRVFAWDDESRLILRNIDFDVMYNADKSDYACAFANEIRAESKIGFLLNEDGKIIPANKGAMYSYELGVDDYLKFRLNQKTGIRILHETFELDYANDEYEFYLDETENSFTESYKIAISYDRNNKYVGFNTGCSDLFPNKKMTVEQHIYLIKEFLKYKEIRIVLLGGREDTERNNIIFNSFGSPEKKRIINTPTDEGLRKGACYMDIADAVITGDTFGLHLAIALKKFVIVWFGLSCASEIELYGRGEKLSPENLECSPCWKKDCPHNLECISQIDLEKIVEVTLDHFKIKKVSGNEL